MRDTHTVDAEIASEDNRQHALAKTDPMAAAKSTLATFQPGLLMKASNMRAALEEHTAVRQLVREFVERHMVEGIDYGLIPGTQRKALYKAGAENLTDLFLCTARFVFHEKIEDWAGGFFYYLIKCEIVVRETGTVIAEAIGSCNSRESKYRFRKGERVCPECQAPAIRWSAEKEEFYCWRKKDGCGAKFGADDKRITGQSEAKVENDNPADVTHTVLQIAVKRSHVGAAIRMAKCGDIFTQDKAEKSRPAAQIILERIDKVRSKEEFASLGADIKIIGRRYREAGVRLGVWPAEAAKAPAETERQPGAEG